MAPTPFSVSRSLRIDAPVAQIEPLITDFREWPSWSPWEDADPDMTRHHDGPDSGVGAVYRWEGNRKAGAGVMTIVDVQTGSSVRIDLEFTRPFAASNVVTFSFAEGAGGETTEVEWTMSGHSTGLAKIFTKFMPMDRLVGRDFERGLTALRARAESVGPR